MSQLIYDAITREEIYQNYLSEIDGIRFTPREVDVISSILHCKSIKSITQFLSTEKNSLSIKSVESHISNIRRKISGASKDSIISFIEKSDKYKFVLRYYRAFLLEREFKKTIYEIKEVIKYSNLKLKLEDNRTIDSSDSLEIIKNHVIGYLTVLSSLEQVEDFTISIIPLTHDANGNFSKNLLYIVDDVAVNSDKRFHEKDNYKRIFIKSYKNFYFFFFEMLKLIFIEKTTELEEIFDRFKDRFESIYEPSHNNSLASKTERSDLKLQLSDTFRHIQNNKYYIVLIILLLGIISSIYLQQFFRDQIKSELKLYEKKGDKMTNLNLPWNTPYLPSHFVKRIDLRIKIITNFSNKPEKDNKTLNKAILVGIHGLGGVGKTYLALDIINNPEKKYSFRGWFTSNDASMLKSDYIKLGFELGLLSDDMQEEQKIAMVRNWLGNQENLLLVFDNAPDMETIEKYLPKNGDIVVTSRNYKIPTAIEVDGMSEAEAVELLGNLVPKTNSKADLAILVKQLGYLPLAIAQAGAYIDQNQITVSKYLELYKEQQNVLLTSDVMPVSDRHLPVYITWNLTLKEIREKDKTGKSIELLNLMSFCHFVDIPKPLLIEYLYGAVNNKTEIEFNKITAFLRQYSLIKVTNSTLAIHHLLQDCVRSNMNIKQQETVLNKVVDTIKKVYALQNNKPNNYELVKVLLPQMESFLTYMNATSNEIYTVELARYIADAYQKLGDYYKSRVLLEKIIAIQEKLYGSKKHIEISYNKRLLGTAYLWSGHYKQARVLLEEVLEFQEFHHKTRKNIDVATTLSNLGICYLWLGEAHKAKDILQEVLEFYEKQYGMSKNEEVVFALNQLGRAYLWLGDYTQAKYVVERALDIQEKHYGTRRNIEVSITLCHLARVNMWLGNYLIDKKLLEEALDIQEEYYGTRDHVQVANTISRLGIAYLNLKDCSTAKSLLEEALVIRKRKQGINEHNIANNLKHLGSAYLCLDNKIKAKELLEEALAIQVKSFGTRNHSEIASTLMNLGKIYFSSGDTQKSKLVFNEALTIREKTFGVNHAEVANTLTYLAEVEYKAKNYKYALSLLERARNILLNNPKLNPEHNYIKKANKLWEEILNIKK